MKLRILAFLLSAVLLCSFCGCEKSGKPHIERTVEPTAVDHVWHAEYIPFPENTTASGALTVSGDRVFMNGTYRPDPNARDTKDVVLQFFTETGTFGYDPLPAPAGIPENSMSVCGVQLPDGGSAYVYNVPGDSSAQEEYLLIAADRDGNQRFCVDARALFDPSSFTGYFFIADIAADADGNICLFSRNAVAAASSADGHFLWQYTCDSILMDHGTTPDGRIYVTVPTPGGEETRYLDGEKKGLGDLLPSADVFPSLRDGKLLLGGGYDLYYAAENGLYAANLTDTEPVVICDWLNSDISYNSIDLESLTVVSPERILCISRDPLTQKRVLCVMTPVAPGDVPTKYIVHIGKTFSGSAQYLNNCVLAFNRESELFRAVIDDYTATGTELMQTSEDKLAAAVVRGEQPDLLFCDRAFDYEKFDRQGLFQDLYPFLKDPDSALRRDDLLSCVGKAMENEKGELHLLPETFLLHTVYAKTDDIGEKTAWTMEEFLDAAEAAPEGTYFWPGYGRAAFADLLRFSLDTFIDTKKLTCSFDSALFGRFLTFCRDLPQPEINDLDLERVHNGELLLCPETEHFESGITEYLKCRYYGFGGASVTPIGFPSAKGNGSVLEPETVFGITADSPVADGAWEFICLYLSGKDVADSDFLMTAGRFGFPSTKAGLEACFANERNIYYVLPDAYSWHGTDANGKSDEEMRAMLNGQGVIAHLTKEDETDIPAMLDGVSRVKHRWEEEVLAMIAEDAAYYFSGAKTLEETQKVIQGRVSVYVSETMG